MTPPLLIDAEEVERLTGVPAETLRAWRREGRGPRWAKIGRRWVTRPADVEEWVNAHFPRAVECHACGDAVKPQEYCTECGRVGADLAPDDVRSDQRPAIGA